MQVSHYADCFSVYLFYFCSKRLTDCCGHFGYVQLELPVFHAGYFKHTLTILQCICKRCSRVLLPFDERQSFLKKLRNPRIDALLRDALFKRIVNICKRNSRCTYCEYGNGIVKKIGSGCFKIVHERHRAKNAEDQADAFAMEMQELMRFNPDALTYAPKDIVSITTSLFIYLEKKLKYFVKSANTKIYVLFHIFLL
jgi:DNA-directed RNA polymerase III subunit RPC1